MALILSMCLLFILNGIRCWQVNMDKLQSSLPEKEQYLFSQIVVLSLVYALTFGSELAVISMFPQFLENTFALSIQVAGALGSSFAIMNLITRPGGGWISDRFGRRATLFALVFGASFCYWGMSGIDKSWSLVTTILLAVICSGFLQAGNGACFAAIPLISKHLTGKLAGLAGAYGSIGAVVFLTLFSFVSPQIFFKILAGYAFLVFLSLFFLKPFSFTENEPLKES